MTVWRPEAALPTGRRPGRDRGLPGLLLCGLLACSLAQAAPEPPAAAAGTASPANAALVPYHARYAVYRNGKLTGKIDIDLGQQGNRWVIRSEARGTHGLARILAARDNEESAGYVIDGRFRPDRYYRHTRVAGIDDRWTVHFDWKQRRVSVVHDNDDPLLLDMLDQDALDPLALKLDMRHRLASDGFETLASSQALAEGEPALHFDMVEEDEIDEQVFRVLPPEWMETSLGCLRTTVVEKVRQNSTRYTRAWHAPELDYMEVRMEHGKTGGNHMEMRITQLTVNGVDVTPRPGCAARQAAGETE
jgi:hypothetical protein